MDGNHSTSISSLAGVNDSNLRWTSTESIKIMNDELDILEAKESQRDSRTDSPIKREIMNCIAGSTEEFTESFGDKWLIVREKILYQTTTLYAVKEYKNIDIFTGIVEGELEILYRSLRRDRKIKKALEIIKTKKDEIVGVAVTVLREGSTTVQVKVTILTEVTALTNPTGLTNPTVNRRIFTYESTLRTG